MKTPIYVTTKVSAVRYQCPHCEQITNYQTDGLPIAEECHKCLKPLKWEIVILADEI